MFHVRALTTGQTDEALMEIERNEILAAIASARSEGFVETEIALIELLRTIEMGPSGVPPSGGPG